MSNFGELNVISVQNLNKNHANGQLIIKRSNQLSIPCALGKNGIRVNKKEGDGASPKGIWFPKKVYYRQDRCKRPITKLPIFTIKQSDGWCDDPNDRNYNRAVKWPYPSSAENLWRKDELYDVLIVLDHNQKPRIKGKGSAIFIHVAKKGFKPTEGCIALDKHKLLQLLPALTLRTKIII